MNYHFLILFFFGVRTGEVVIVDEGIVESIIVFILGNDEAESDERNAKRSSDDVCSYLTEDTKKKLI